MRHRSIETTMKYYVDLDADDISEQLWQEYRASEQEVGTFVGTSDFPPQTDDAALTQEMKKALL